MALFSTLVGTALALGAILAGFTDAKPLGRLAVDDPLTAVDGWRASSSEATWEVTPDEIYLEVTQSERRIYLTSPYSVTNVGTIEITARQTGGASDAMFGVWWGDEQTRMAAAISGDGYFGVSSVRGTSNGMAIDWHRFPWLLPQGESNRIRIDFSADGQVQIRLNDEAAGALSREEDDPVEVGLYVETTRNGGSTVLFERLRIWQNEP